ncbi:arylsulfatase [Blastopirellula marina]|uniref:Arylsulfatase n=1 Tax=Blastopirellula marina TaxID=124 RepID=A0A2S8FSU8_9BACT|nr:MULTISPECIES: sulfatase [Pirellulaceae]PQO35246.1 arylsulfatase [Blastopirellula marina]RCS53115.1 arylsulfatase [Bremerella cremea]
MFQFLAISTRRSGTSGCRRTFPRHLLHRITTLASAASLVLFAQLFFTAPLNAESRDRPNIILILSDDLAWSDLKCYGHPWHRTPHIDRLADGGVRFTNAYASAPICSASRASLLTGKTTASLGFEFVTKNSPGSQNIDGPTALVAPPLTLNLALAESTIAERLTEQGYETAFFGKWHLNQHHGRYLGWSPTHGPKQQGFQIAEEDFGAHPYSWGQNPPATIDAEGRFADDSMVERVCRYIRQPHERPYFAMASSFYVHTPVRTPLKWLTDHYENTIPIDAKNRANRVKYAAFLETLDHHVGEILDAVEASGTSDNTLVVFFSDNGGHPEYTANAPLRGSKWNLYEGGIRVPLIVRWPGRTKPGTESITPVVGYDLPSTFVQASGGDNEGVEGEAVPLRAYPISEQESRDLIWHFPYYHPETGYNKAKPTIGVDDFVVSKTKPQSAIRREDFKLIWFAEDDRVELYNLAKDPSEQVDLSEIETAKSFELRAALHQYLRDHHARMAMPR